MHLDILIALKRLSRGGADHRGCPLPLPSVVFHSVLVPGSTLLLLFFASSLSARSGSLNVSPHFSQGRPEFEFLIDARNGLGPENLRQQAFTAKQDPARVLNLGQVRSPVWIHLEISGATRESLLLTVENPSIDRIVLYWNDGGAISKIGETGRRYPISSRDVEERFFTFRLPYHSGETNSYYLEVESETALILPLIVRTESAHDRAVFYDSLIQGGFFGWIAVMIFYNLFLFANTREKGNLHYAIMLIFSNFLFQSSLNGILPLLFPETPAIPRFLHNSIYALSELASANFVIQFIASRKYSPLIHWLLIFGAVMAGVSIPLSFVVPFRGINMFLDYLAAFLIVASFTGGWLTYRAGYKPARYFFMGFGVVLIGGMTTLLQYMGLLPTDLLTVSAFQAAQSLEVILIGFALADRYRYIQKESEEMRRKTDVQAESLRSLRQELTLAGRIHAKLLPTEMPAGIAVRQLSSAVIGGDLYHLSRQPDGAFRVLLADVAGHGLPAALEASMLLVTYRESNNGESPSSVIKRVHTSMTAVLPDLMITAILVEIRQLESGHEMILASAGHPHCMVLRKKEGTVLRPPVRGKPIGIGEHWTESCFELQPEDRILLYTDGLSETTSEDNRRQEFGIERIQAELLQHGSIGLDGAADRMLTSLLLWARREPEDDVTFVMIEPDRLPTKPEFKDRASSRHPGRQESLP